jgi:hypothetical protein
LLAVCLVADLKALFGMMLIPSFERSHVDAKIFALPSFDIRGREASTL